ncbi:protein RER1-like [Halichondria panicea]|uniref:protein RER1-like n=1 Tax=Halichondria panicea TaxID=6063 RepID=UPI00312B56B6
MSDPLVTSSSPSIFQRISIAYQKYLDLVVPFPIPRWIGCTVLLLLYFVRVYFLQGWYIVTYALAIYLLNLFIAFLTPKFDPAAAEEDDIEDGPGLPTSSNEEFKPFIRRLPEFKFWLSAIRSILIALFCTFFSLFNIPVFWPILVIYFIMLLVITMRRQIKHMVRYRYLPFSYGKRRYKGKEEAIPSQ